MSDDSAFTRAAAGQVTNRLALALADAVDEQAARITLLERSLAAHHALADLPPGPRLGHGGCPVCAATEREPA